ncbi:MAG: hypothetical protein CL678_02965 [Bdellovibrionaceae bacterium]|nr:hypothetical protein [Pseudobdellovibrionaceae bacterium]|tara:strand:+ start:2223 stop:2936 length:714 start_codon:yes stop_codon:yes gene_type:complete
MKTAIMQPYLFPYIGYFQLAHHSEQFVFHDDVQFIKGGWINRNRYLINNEPQFFTINLNKAPSDYKINQRIFSEACTKNKTKILGQFISNYKKAPFKDEGINFLEKAFRLILPEKNLADTLIEINKLLFKELKIFTHVSTTSSLHLEDSLKGQERVIKICKIKNTTEYTNPIGGIELYSTKEFSKNNLKLQFIESAPEIQNSLPHNHQYLSIIDTIAWIGLEQTRKLLSLYQLKTHL